jgi:hypothetical protein
MVTAQGMPSTEGNRASRQKQRREFFMDRSKRRRRRAVERDVLRAMRRTEQTLDKARSQSDRANDVLTATEDHGASGRGRKIKELLVD